MMQRSASALSRRIASSTISRPAAPVRMLGTSCARRSDKSADADPKPGEPSKLLKSFDEIRTMDDLLPPGAEPGTMPTDLEQATGLERLEILGKMQGIDIFDMRPLDSSRIGTLTDPILVKSAGNEQFAGCTGCPADSHNVRWLGMSRARPMNRCDECGSVYLMEYVGPDDTHGHGHGHGDDHGHHEDPLKAKWEQVDHFSEYVRKEYKGVPESFPNGHLL